MKYDDEVPQLSACSSTLPSSTFSCTHTLLLTSVPGVTHLKNKTNLSRLLAIDFVPVPGSHYAFLSELAPRMPTLSVPKPLPCTDQQAASITPLHGNCSSRITSNLDAKKPM